MATANLGISAVERLAAALDSTVAGCWDPAATMYACVNQFDGNLDLRVGAPPERTVLAVAVTSVGIGRRTDGGVAEEQTVRVTVAVSCCQAVAVVRKPDGRVEHADRAAGVTVAMLREWSSLERCAVCASREDGSTAREGHH